MTTTLRQTEAIPATYPGAPAGLSTAAAALDPDFIWQRIEAYTVWRWSERPIEWLVEGPGHWRAPLNPATIETTERWTGSAWAAETPPPSPLGGYELQGCGPYRFVGTLGEDAAVVPAAVLEAFRRLAEYMAAKSGKPGATSESVSAGSVTLSHNRSAEWMARAMINSGAADLLRRYRRA